MQKWAWGVIGALLVTWLTAVSAATVHNTTDIAVVKEVLPRVEGKIDGLNCYLRKVDCK